MHNHSIISLSFASNQQAEWSKHTLEVDEELQPDKVEKAFALDNTTLKVYVHIILKDA